MVSREAKYGDYNDRLSRALQILDNDRKWPDGDRRSARQQSGDHGQHSFVVRVAEAKTRDSGAKNLETRGQGRLALLSKVQTNGGGAEGSNLRGHPEENGERDRKRERRPRPFVELHDDRHHDPASAQAQNETSSTNVQREALENA